MSRLIAIATALSFVAMLLPIAASTANSSNVMACCIGKTAGHCDTGLELEKPPEPEPEPMCGMETHASDDDGITIIAEPLHKESHHSFSGTADPNLRAAESNSLSQACHMDCCACATSTVRQQKREGIARTGMYDGSPTRILSPSDNLAVFFSANEDWKQASPRGPPYHSNQR